MVKFAYRGLIAPVFAPFNNDNNFSLNLSVVPKYAEYLSRSGIEGILVNGTVGEGPSLNLNERKSVCEAWAKTVKETKQHLMVQIGGTSLTDVLELAKHAESQKVDSLLCLPDLYYQPKNADQLVDYLKIVGEAAPNTPLLYYHIPSFTNVNIHMGKFLYAVDGKIPNFVGIKFTSTCLDEGVDAANVLGRKYAVFLGADTLMLGAYSLGMDSAIATSFNVYPHGLEIFNNATTNHKEALKKQQELTSIINKMSKFGHWVEIWKLAMNSLTPINVGPPRLPLKTLSEDGAKKMLLSIKID